MPWFKVDDKLWGHPKWLALSPRARGLWVTAGSWSAAMGTGGFIPRHVVGTLSGTRPDAVQLVQVGLWVECDKGWTFHDWDVFQPDSASERARREAESKGGDLGNHRRWHVKRKINVPGCEFCQTSGPDRVPDRGADSPPNPPDPTRPEKNSRPAEPDTFAEWWAAYPRKEGKGRALPAYRKALKSITADELLTLTRQWFADRPDLEPRFTPQPTSWLNGQRWTDERPGQSGAPSTGASFWNNRVGGDR